jgi:hypothetical protein
MVIVTFLFFWTSRGRHLKRYSVISITLSYVFASSQNTLTLLGSVIASIIYRSRHIGAVIASYGYCSKLIDQRYCFYSLSFFRSSVQYMLFTSRIPSSKELERDKTNCLAEFDLIIHNMYI